jgi:hypothetical protein
VRAYRHIGGIALSSPILSDDILEFHAARILLLISECGVDGTIDSLTKLAKLDFFVRYPSFLQRISGDEDVSAHVSHRPVESSMVRFKYGPWDHRYYQLLPYLEGRGLIKVKENDKNIEFSITERGKEIAGLLGSQSAFSNLSEQMRQVKKNLGKKSGSALKKLIYKTFEAEVAKKHYGERIK